jgi:hypothetical protein
LRQLHLQALRDTSRALPRSLQNDAGASRPQIQKRCWDQRALSSDPANVAAGFEIMGLAPFPTDASTYAHYPLTMAYSQPLPGANTDAFKSTPGPTAFGVKKMALMWAHRCSPSATSSRAECVGANTKTYSWNFGTSPCPSDTCRKYNVFYTSVAKANACTMASSLAVFGATEQQIRAPLDAAGVTYAIDESPLRAVADQLATPSQRLKWAGQAWYSKYTAANVSSSNNGIWVRDICYVPWAPGGASAGISKHVYGIAWDYEVADHRTADQSGELFEAMVPQLRALKPGAPLLVINNSIFGAGAASGLGPRLYNAVDAVGIDYNPGVRACENRHQALTADSLQAHFNQQIARFTGEPIPADKSKFMVYYGFTDDENVAPQFREMLLSGGYKYVLVHMPYIRQMSCDVSDATNALVTNPARHMRDLFNLPKPLP